MGVPFVVLQVLRSGVRARCVLFAPPPCCSGSAASNNLVGGLVAVASRFRLRAKVAGSRRAPFVVPSTLAGRSRDLVAEPEGLATVLILVFAGWASPLPRSAATSRCPCRSRT